MTAVAWPSVSAVIPTRDRPELLDQAVRSVLAQRYPGPLECVVAFDQQRPALPRLEAPPGRQLIAVANDRSPGLAGARNAGAAAATGDLLAWCDDDDEWFPDKLWRQVEAMRRVPQAAVATCGIELCTGRRHFRRVPGQVVVSPACLLRSRQMWVHSSTLLIRRERFFGDIGPADEEVPGSYGEDYEWILRASGAAPIIAVRAPLVRVHWQASYYAGHWDTIISGICYHLRKHPELTTDSKNAARMYGRLAFACAAAGRPGQARAWASRSIRRDWRQPRGYLAMLVCARLVPPRRVTSLAHALGKGV